MVNANILGEWIELDNDNFLIEGGAPSYFMELVYTVKELFKHNNGFVEIFNKSKQIKYYVHYTSLQFSLLD